LRRPFTGNDIPLVSRYRQRASAGTSGRTISVADATVRAWSNAMDNDQAGLTSATVDFKLSGAYEHCSGQSP
jgi:hypothetical protein